MTFTKRWIALAAAATLAGCAVGPRYQGAPAIENLPAAFKEAGGDWVPAQPQDGVERGAWWQLFQDPQLAELARRVEVSNQNVAAAVAAYQQARALVAQQRAGLFPSASLSVGANRNGSNGGGSASSSTSSTASGTTGAGVTVGGGGSTRNNFSLSLGGSWEPDVWGRLSAGVSGATAGEQASLADLAAARLSAQGELATNYFNLRSLDVQRDLLARTVEGYTRTVTITQNRYNAGIAARTDLLQAQTQLANARADLLDLQRQRAALEHAIAVLVGQVPANFSLKAEPTWRVQVPPVPGVVPSTLLQRRPDIAAAERRVAQANEQIGIARAAYFPSLRLTASAGAGAAAIGDLLNASSLVWGLGLSAAQTLFNAGLTAGQVEGAQASYAQSVARYRQTVLGAFQQVEDQLSAARVLNEELALREEASRAADLVEQQVLNRYQAGQVAFTEVITAQNTAQNARRALVQLQANRQVAAVALVQALGGGWQGLAAEGAAATPPAR